ncbi:MAG: exosortase U [Planctomycetaceae bacterium]|nr:exosortase U [Planctomycetaceae bacterium]
MDQTPPSFKDKITSLPVQLVGYARNNPVAFAWVVAHLPFLVLYYVGLWRHQTHYQFFPFALLAFLLLARQRSSGVFHKDWRTTSLIGLDVLFVLASLAIFSPWLMAIGAFCLTLAWCIGNQDVMVSRRRLTSLALLPALTLRLPSNGDVQVIQSLQSLTTRFASKSLHQFGFIHIRSGNVLDFPGKRFLVEEACSGVQSLFTVLFLAALVIAMKRRGRIHSVIMLLSGVCFAGLMNVLRIITIAVAWQRYQIDWSTGLSHDILGYICLGVAAALMLSADAFLSFFTESVPEIRRPGAPAGLKNPIVRAWNWFVAPHPIRRTQTSAMAMPVPKDQPAANLKLRAGVLFAAACLLVTQCYSLIADPLVSKTTGKSSLKQFEADSLASAVSGFKQQAYREETRETDNPQGEFSNIWMYQQPGLQAHVACDHPFYGWHSLQTCYIAQGWQVHNIETKFDDDWACVIVRMSHPQESQYGTLFYSLFDRTGRPLEPPGANPGNMLVERLFRNQNFAMLDTVTYQSQVFVPSRAELSPEELNQVTELHFEMRQRMRSLVTKGQ